MQDTAAESQREAVRELAKRLEEMESVSRPLTQKEIWDLKLEICKEYSLNRVPKNSEILTVIKPEFRSTFEGRLRRKGIRTKSGIAIITAITKPFDCPHGTCTFCPGGVRFGTPQSYTKNSPAAVFGTARNFDPVKQVSDSLRFLKDNGHDTSKVELILLGGTILAMPIDYQKEFVKKSYDALNEKDSFDLSQSLIENEKAQHRCVGLTIETKPDWCREEHIDLLLSYGATRVEIGVQSLREEVLTATNRGHTLADTVKAFQVARDSAFKIVAHMMPGLPRSDSEKDLEDLLALFDDEKYRPDMLKIYPTLVVEGTALFRLFKMGKYHPYDLDTLVDLLCRFKQRVPPWVRIMRIQREIPNEEIFEGARAGNLRQIVLDEIERRGQRCRCIRCREVGHKSAPDGSGEFEMNPVGIRLNRYDYEASGGREVFLSFENESLEILHGFLRLRIPSGLEHRTEILGTRASLVRELHVYGPVVPVGERTPGVNQSQHRGLGSRLLAEAERISKEEFRKTKQIVISASGTKEYYRKRGYKDDGAFVSKQI